MKNKKLLFILPAMLLVTACGSTASSESIATTSSEESSEINAGATQDGDWDSDSQSKDETVNAFQEQLAAAGITTVQYEDPNAPIYEKEVKPSNDEDVDLITGCSGAGTDYYANGGSYYTLDQMVKRASMQYYYSITWDEATEKDTEKATTLAEAANLSKAKYVKAAFPNDGKAYKITMKGNAIATKSFVTVGKDGSTSVAVIGCGAKKIDNDYYITGSLVNKTTLANLLYSGKAQVLIYEYTYTSGDKAGAGARNYGCRLDVTVDTEKSYFMGKTYDPLEGDAKNFVIGSETYPEGAVAASIYLKVTHMYTLG